MIIGTGLWALNALGGGNGIFGIGGGAGSGSYAQGAGTMAAGTMLGASIEGGWLGQKEILDQEYDLVRMGQIEADMLRTAMHTREIDSAEKFALYKDSVAGDIAVAHQVGNLKDFTIAGLSDVYQAGVANDKALAEKICNTKYEAYKNTADLYATTVVADKELELQIERNREVDQAEKFSLYKELSGQTNALAFQSMKQSYDDRIAAMNQVNALAGRVCALEAKEQVNAATLPLMFSLAESQCNANLYAATCRKIDGNLTIYPNQICNPVIPPVGAPYGPFPPFGPATSGCCGGSTQA